jgi:putative spermidine/putrescine transport system ATP-binding protein
MQGLSVRNVVRTFPGGIRALDDISLDIPDGKLICFLGPSGCGKTTLLRIIAGLDQPSGGSVVLGKKDITMLPAYRRGFGMVFQSLALFPHLSVAGNIAYSMRIAGVDRRRRAARVAELLELIRLPEVGDRPIGQLSGGQKQRVAIARALAQEPRLLLLDEPMSALDAKLREDMQVELRLLQKKLALTTILVTHDQREAMTMADIIVVMRDGRIEQIDPPLEVYGDPATLFVAGFIGQSNFLPARIERDAVLIEGRPMPGISLPARREGDAVTVAIRPENLRLRRLGEASANSIEGRIQFIRDLGASIEVHLNGGALRLIGTCQARDWPDFQEGEQVAAELPPECCKVFAGHG